VNPGLAWARHLGRKHAHKLFPLSALQTRQLDTIGYSAWMAYREGKAKTEGVPKNRVWY
jgi:hypothetical protein